MSSSSSLNKSSKPSSAGDPDPSDFSKPCSIRLDKLKESDVQKMTERKEEEEEEEKPQQREEENGDEEMMSSAGLSSSSSSKKKNEVVKKMEEEETNDNKKVVKKEEAAEEMEVVATASNSSSSSSAKKDVVYIDEDDDDDDFKTSKKKTNNTRRSSNGKRSNSSTPASKAKKSKVERCSSCRVPLDAPNLKFYLGHPEGAMEEDIALFQPSLLIEGTGIDEPLFDGTDFDKPSYRLTNFTFYDTENHVVQFGEGIIERNAEIFFSGYVKPVIDDTPTTEGAVPVRDCGPLVAWWATGFDGGDKHLVGVTTPSADYYLTEPASDYADVYADVDRKVLISKVVIDYLNEAKKTMDLIEYDDLLSKAESKLPSDISAADEIIKHANFIVSQVYSYEEAGDEDEETFMMESPCIQEIIDLSGMKKANLKKSKGAGILRTKGSTAPKKKDFTKATTTPLVRFVFETFFKDQMEESGNKDVSVIVRKRRCLLCDGCQVQECGSCTACKDMKKFGGSGKSKQACEKRKCTNMITYEDNSASMSEEEEEGNKENHHGHNRPKSPVHKKGATGKTRSKGTDANIDWPSKPWGQKGDKIFYGEVSINGEKYSVGDGALFTYEGDDATYVRRIEHLYRWEDGDSYAHLQWFIVGTATLLNDAANDQEVFQEMHCEEGLLSNIIGKAKINYWPLPVNWKTNGGIDSFPEPPVDKDDKHCFWYRMRYNEENARFEHGSQSVILVEDTEDLESCTVCQSSIKQEKMEKGVLRAYDRLEEECDSMGNYKFKSFQFLSKMYHVDDAIFISMASSGPNPVDKGANEEKLENRKGKVDEDKYPEFYRKTTTIRGSNEGTSKPFGIGIIEEIISPESKGKRKITIKLRKMYRPEDSCLKTSEAFAKDFNMVYWSDDIISVDHSRVMGRCFLRSEHSIDESVESWAKKGEYRFYYNMAYNKREKQFEDLSAKAERYGRPKGSKGKGGKGTQVTAPETAPEKEDNGAFPNISRPLRCLDVFAGCGGLSLGLHQSGIAESRWAIEFYEPAAKAYKMNNPNCTVFTDDCNNLLKEALEGEGGQSSKKDRLPAKGEVELLCGGPPCQGFSGMNRFNSREYSAFKNSLIATYLSYCDYYRPRFFILENVRNFATFKKSAVLRMCMKALLRMGYACTFGILQAGNFGVAQTRRRAILLAAAPGEHLPLYPEPQTAFANTSLSAQVSDRVCVSNCRWTDSAPYRNVTVRDTTSDLPEIKNGQMDLVMAYDNEPTSHFQRRIRDGADCLRDHICKAMSPLVEARMSLIPIAPGADWRDLPNTVVKLSDGTYSDKLIYNYADKVRGKSSTGALRGVCICMSGSKNCDPDDKQGNTLIPWCLPHTSARHNQWAGLYGRLSPCGYFHTTVTNPEPMGKQGQVLHPEQHRVVSVRECARSQGFPDWYRFHGTILEKHRQVGNAVPPPMGFAIGMEIRKALAKGEEERNLIKKDEEEEEEEKEIVQDVVEDE